MYLGSGSMLRYSATPYPGLTCGSSLRCRAPPCTVAASWYTVLRHIRYRPQILSYQAGESIVRIDARQGGSSRYCLRGSYALSGTDLRHGASQCPVLSERMLLRQERD
eukprot:412447-Rhodomonas_salina.5